MREAGRGKSRASNAMGTREVETKTGEHGVGKPVPWHEVLNIGETTRRYLLVEKKYRRCSLTPSPPAPPRSSAPRRQGRGRR